MILFFIMLTGMGVSAASILRWRYNYKVDNQLLSQPARYVLKSYRKLPSQYQNISGIENTLLVMDVKSAMTRGQLALHYTNNNMVFDINHCSCKTHRCQIPDYTRMIKSLNDIHEEVEAAERIDRLNAIEPGTMPPDEIVDTLALEYQHAVMYTEAISGPSYRELSA